MSDGGLYVYGNVSRATGPTGDGALYVYSNVGLATGPTGHGALHVYGNVGLATGPTGAGAVFIYSNTDRQVAPQDGGLYVYGNVPKPTAVSGTVFFRMSDDGTSYWQVHGSSLSFVSSGGSVDYSIGNTLQDGDLVRVYAKGALISVYVNGSLRTTITDARNQTATRHGIAATEAVDRFDDFSLSEVKTPTTIVSFDANVHFLPNA